MTDRLLRAYQVMATIVGINLLLVMTGFLGKLVSSGAQPWFEDHQAPFLVIDQIHGFLFMILIVLVARLGLRQKWSWGYMLSVILLACIPLISFWAERRTSHRVAADAALAV